MALFVDRPLSVRLERAEGAVSASFAEARRRLDPSVAAASMSIAGAQATFDGVDSPLTQTFGLGLVGDADGATLSRIETFFTERGAATNHEVSPFAGVEVLGALARRGYVPIEVSNVLVRVLDGDAPTDEAPLAVRRCEAADEHTYVDTAVRGWSADDASIGVIRALARMTLANASMTCFVVEDGGRAIATGALGIHDGVALFAGASTIPESRRRGAQRALFVPRIAEAYRRRCDLAMVVAEPGSPSHRNAERNGFVVAYTRTKWSRPREA